jgi:antitoxin component YwqK of YwqJK toxin-antitoxin module
MISEHHLVHHETRVEKEATDPINMLSGEWDSYYSGSELIRKWSGNFLCGKRHGFWTFYDMTGYPILTGVYEYGKKVGRWQKYYENSACAKKMSVVDYIRGKKEGTKLKWYENGNQMMSCGYHNNLLHGEMIEWFETKNIKTNAYYIDGLLEGSFVEYYDILDKKRCEGRYRHGVKTGRWIYYEEDGTQSGIQPEEF